MTNAAMADLNPATTAAFLIYLLVILAIAVVAWRRTRGGSDYFLGGRSLSPTVAAISAAASDMSGWLLLGLPGFAYLAGLESIWIAIGLVVGVAANWRLVAARLRNFSAQLDDAVTVPAYLARRFNGRSRWLQPLAAAVILLFFLFYVSAGLIGGGKLFNVVFGIDYQLAVLLGAAVILLYTLFGGFLAVSWSDLFQGLLMMVALIAVPLVVSLLGSDGPQRPLPPALLDPFSNASGESLGLLAIASSLAWGLGYFGQPHILARFMAIRSADEVALATRIGVFWSFAGLAAAIAVGISGYQYFAPPSYAPLADAEQVFVALTNALFSPLLAGVLLAAILAAIMSTVDSQLLVSSAALAEDLYPQLRQWLTPHSRESERERLWVARLAVVGLAAVATLLALNPESSVLGVVSYAWAGLGAGLGPVVLLSLFWSRMTAAGAVAGLLVGATTVLVWGNLSGGLFDLYELLPAFVAALLAVVAVSALGAHGDCDARLTALRRN